MDKRNARDVKMMEIQRAADDHSWEAAREKMKRKTQLYEKLRRGDDSGLTDAQREALLVDVRRTSLPFNRF